MKFRKRLIVVFFVTITLLGFSLGQESLVLGEYNILTLDHTPKPLQQYENITVSISFSDTSNITYVKLFICRLEPEFLCEDNPIFMQETEPFSYVGTFLIIYDEGTLVGYHIQLVYSNGSFVVIPDSINFGSISNIVEPVEGDYYISAGIVGETVETSSFSFLFVGFCIAFIFIVIRRKKDKLNR
ncbi:MAG: hypothetical protein KAS63_10215 [Candidatus Heimdallarchaeota archaeon]|nr:hypothetical protein [Candidatus Heimdallarchaeota archaeon]MCK4955727.1 hypothetical protein [Candidatus Heimdallarchaeota archaeon]